MNKINFNFKSFFDLFIGYGMVLLFHTTYIPACFKLHRSCFLCCDDNTWTSDFSSLDSEYTRKEFERDENDLSK